MFTRFIGIRVAIILLLALAALGYWWKHTQPPQPIGIAHIADREVILWNTLAQVREPVAELHYGDRVEVLRREGLSVQLRTAAGILGWLTDAHQMMDAPIWQQSIDLLAHARTMSPQARGRTKTVSNIRVAPGRNGDRIFQFLRGTPVVVLSRQVADAPQASEENPTPEKNPDASDQKSKQEDWLFVMSAEDVSSVAQSALPASAKTRSSPNPVSNGDRVDQSLAPGGLPPAPIAGWVLARFIELDLPGPVKDYVNAADLHVVAWFELNRVPNGSGGEAPQYLVAGARGGEGQPCDFTLLRVYTWGSKRQRYETAYVESDLCGKLPIQVSNTKGMPEFRFADTDDTSAERVYVMRQTEVRRVKEPSTRTLSPRS
jgi:hypothetical protein